MGDKHVEVKGAGNYILTINYMPKLQTISGYNTKHKLFNIVLCGFGGQICLSVCVSSAVLSCYQVSYMLG